MAENMPTGPVEMGAAMDYAEHEKTYGVFLALSKYGALTCAAIMIALAFAFFGGGGFISGTILFVLVVAIGAYLLR